MRCLERPGAVKGAPLLGAAKRTLDGEDRSEKIAEEGKAGRKLGERWAAILVALPAASNTSDSASGGMNLENQMVDGRERPQKLRRRAGDPVWTENWNCLNWR